MTKNEEKAIRICANGGCRNPVSGESGYCDACELEWLLFRRDLRPSATGGREDVRRIRRAVTP